MLCSCHDAPAYWQKDSRMKAGGWWKCAVAHRQDARDRYDRDPVHRIGKLIHDAATKRRRTIQRRREQLGALPLEG